MKKLFFLLPGLCLLLFACNEMKNDKQAETNGNKDSILTTSPVKNTKDSSAVMNEILTSYLNLKNALANDDGKQAGNAAVEMKSSLSKINTGSFTAGEKKVFEDVHDDLAEHAEHIASSSGDISHQREHFDMMSQDMIDLVKSTGSNQTLYKVYCPMYNNNKGAMWLSESKEIKNPYLGKKMPTCGEVKEEIKPE
jgi:hypothetical protein